MSRQEDIEAVTRESLKEFSRLSPSMAEHLTMRLLMNGFRVSLFQAMIFVKMAKGDNNAQGSGSC